MEQWGASRKDIDKRRREFQEQVARDWESAVYRSGSWRTPAGELLAIEILPENLLPWIVFRACDSQWEFPGGFSGRCALSWTEVEAAMRLIGIPRDQRAEVFMAVKVLVEHGRARIIERQPRK